MAPMTVNDYLAALPEERRNAMNALVDTIRTHLPEGFEETMSHAMPGWVVPHTRYKPGYHVDPKKPLPFLSIASQRSHMALYHMGLYAQPDLLDWFVKAYPRHSTVKLNMGKSCVRFKKPAHIPYALIGELLTKMTPTQWVEVYEAHVRPRP